MAVVKIIRAWYKRPGYTTTPPGGVPEEIPESKNLLCGDWFLETEKADAIDSLDHILESIDQGNNLEEFIGWEIVNLQDL